MGVNNDIGLERAIKACRTATELGRRLGVSTALISQWKRIPAERVVEVEQATGVPRHLLRPDLHLPPYVLQPKPAEKDANNERTGRDATRRHS